MPDHGRTLTAGSTARRRRQLRLAGYDYSQPGAYFVTICVDGRRQLFGDVRAGVMAPSQAGNMAERSWLGLPARFPSVVLDVFVVMPNHLHAVLLLSEPEAGAMPASLPRIMQAFKSLTTRAYLDQLAQQGRSDPRGHLWQRGYYERIIRDESELDRVREYVVGNPDLWADDEENPERGCR